MAFFKEEKAGVFKKVYTILGMGDFTKVDASDKGVCVSFNKNFSRCFILGKSVDGKYCIGPKGIEAMTKSASGKLECNGKEVGLFRNTTGEREPYKPKVTTRNR